MTIACVVLDCPRRKAGAALWPLTGEGWPLPSSFQAFPWLLGTDCCTPEFRVSLSCEGKGHLPDVLGLSWACRAGAQVPRAEEAISENCGQNEDARHHGGSASVPPACPASRVATPLSRRESDEDSGLGGAVRTEEILMSSSPW